MSVSSGNKGVWKQGVGGYGNKGVMWSSADFDLIWHFSLWFWCFPGRTSSSLVGPRRDEVGTRNDEDRRGPTRKDEEWRGPVWGGTFKSNEISSAGLSVFCQNELACICHLFENYKNCLWGWMIWSFHWGVSLPGWGWGILTQGGVGNTGWGKFL